MAGSPAERPGHRAGRRAAIAVMVAATLATLTVGLPGCSGTDAPTGTVRSQTTQRTATTTSTVPTSGPASTAVLDPSTVAARPSAGCGRESASEVPAGETESAIDSGGETRTFYLRVPPAHDGKRPVPLVVDFHGFGEGARIHTAFSGMPDLGMADGFVTVTPQGSGASAFWNTFGLPRPDDVAFTSALLDDLGDTLCIDRARTYASGMSNGAFMTSLLACRMSDRFAAVAPVAGAQDPVSCDPSRPVPVIAFHGTDDTYVRFRGGLGPGVRTLGVDPSISLPVLENRSVPEVLGLWANRNGCSRTPALERAHKDVVRMTWPGCRDGADVVLYVIEGGGHTWPGSAVSGAAKGMIGPTTMSIRADELIWDFFRAHPMR